ncbi:MULTISPECIES: acyltransferase [Alteromonas]|jgi:1-acyl-sn-glycerol-3-phosphate acyltransferase|uniref:Acyltransferase n=1 Tax=Alteromonas stellipolaris TaxID=233316 RepID=A0AAW7Z1U0_9ALTE|nr:MULTISPECIES: acyltransferase [Alteromonas]AMJ91968.1 acyltransferase [Alteromonas sp. Mac2]ALM89162.1 Acyltransferase [Alteromonas stellipolaris LMG 21856]AMJ75681.1 acyltransferase [Alteromonas stellipolaris]AMJ88106.1 acyltransferase [Alteromonas sp. Mac1]AMJ95784.1 acyltransferase [Alteromonas stellipolaris]
MIRSLMHHLVGTISVIFYFLNTVLWATPIIILSFFKLIPLAPWRRFISYILDACATAWITINNLNQRVSSRTKWDVTGLDQLTRNDWYLVIANHQSWVDILVLQRVFNRKIPFLKFFLKKELIYVPILGLAWWALDFPFMRRYSKSFLAKNPHLKGKDMETTRKACEKFQTKPVSIMNFVEGTRFTQEKHDRQNSPFSHLLKPKAGGVAFVLSAMGSQLHKLIDVTIDYPGGVPSFWDFVSGKVRDIRVSIKVTPIKDITENGYFNDNYFDDPKVRSQFQRWLNSRWQDKNDQLESINATQKPL